MNFTAISLSLIWNSPIYCICTNQTSYLCNSTCSRYGYIQISSNQSILNAIKYNINRNITFALVDDSDNLASNDKLTSVISISLPEEFFLRHYFTLFSTTAHRIQVNITILPEIEDFKFYRQIQDSSFSLFNVDLFLDTEHSDNSEIFPRFPDLLSLHNSSISISNPTKPSKFFIKTCEIDLKSIVTYENTITDFSPETDVNTRIIFNHPFFSQFQFDELRLYLTDTFIKVSQFNNLSLLIENSGINLILDIDFALKNLKSINLFATSQTSVFETDKSTISNNSFNISIKNNCSFLIPMHFDFSQNTNSYISAYFDCVEPNLHGVLSFDIGSNTISLFHHTYNDNSNSTLPNDTEIDSTFSDDSEINYTFQDDSEIDSTFSDDYEINSTFLDDSEINSTFSDDSEIDSTFSDDSEIDSTFSDDSEIDSTFSDDSEIDSTFSDDYEINSTFLDDSEINSTFSDDSEIDSTLPNDSEIDFISPNDSEINSTYSRDPEINSTFPDDSEINSTFSDDPEIDSTLTNDSEIDSTLPNDSEINSTFLDDSDINSTFPDDSEINSTFSDDSEIDSTFPSDSEIDSTFLDDSEINSTFSDDSEIDSTLPNDSEIDSSSPDDPEINSTYSPDPEINSTFPPDPEINSTLPNNTDFNNSEIIQYDDYLYHPFFLIRGTGLIFINETEIPAFTAIFMISRKMEFNLSDIYHQITISPYENIEIIIQEKVDEKIIIDSDLLANRSFSIISEVLHYTVYFTNCNFQFSKKQYFKNIQIKSINDSTIIFSNLELVNSAILCDYLIDNLNIDTQSLTYHQKYSPSPSLFSLSETVTLQFLTSAQISLYVEEQKLLFEQQKLNLESSRLKKLTLVTYSNISVISKPEPTFKLNYDIQFSLGGNLNITHVSMIFDNFSNDSIGLLDHFSIESDSISVDVRTIGFELPFPNPISILGNMSISFNSTNVLFSDHYCVCQSDECLEVCKPIYGPIVPFDSKQIDHTVQFKQTDYLNYTIYGSNDQNRPIFDYSLYNSTCFDISSLGKQIEYISIKNSNRAPGKQISNFFSNLNIYLTSDFNMNSAIFRLIEFKAPTKTDLFLNILSIDTDAQTLFNIPENIELTSPTLYCIIYCYDIVETLTISNHQTIELNSSFTLNIAKLKGSPCIFQCNYGLTVHTPLRIFLSSPQPTNLAELPDIIINLTEINQTRYVEFPDKWNKEIEDASSRFELLHLTVPLYIQGQFVDDVYTTIPPTIFHNGDGPFYVNGVLSTFKLKYCICDAQTTNCSSLCSSIGPVISFDKNDIIFTVKSNPTRHITYVIYGSTAEFRPYFRLIDFSVKSFTLTSDNQLQYINLETTKYMPVVPLNHRFLYMSINPVYNQSKTLSFYNLEIQNSLIERNDAELQLVQINLIIDLETSYELQKENLLSPSKFLTINGKKTLTKIMVESLTSFTAYSDSHLYSQFNLSQLESPAVISTLIGDKNTSMIRVDLPSYSITFDDFPYMKFDFTQISGDVCYIMFPTSRWVGDLCNLTQKVSIDATRHDLHEESSQHGNKYDGVPPIINMIGSGRYYINGQLYDPTRQIEPPKPSGIINFKKLGPSQIAGILLGSIGLVVLIAGIIYIIIRKRRKDKSDAENSTSKFISFIDIDDNLI